MSTPGWGSPTPSGRYPSVSGRRWPSIRFGSLFRGRSEGKNRRRRPDQMDIRRAEGMYEVIPNNCVVPTTDRTRGNMTIYLDETYGSAINPRDENRIFAIGGFLTDDPDQVDRYASELPTTFLGGTPEQRRTRVRRIRSESGGRKFEDSIHDRPYKYYTLNDHRPDELRFRINEMNERLDGMYVAKVVLKTRDPSMDEYIDDGFGNLVLNGAYPDSHDMYGAVLHDLLEDIQNLYPHTQFDLYLDPSSFMDWERLKVVCSDFSTITPRRVDVSKKDGGLRYADLIVGAMVECRKENPSNDFATEMVSGRIINRNRTGSHRPEPKGFIILSYE